MLILTRKAAYLLKRGGFTKAYIIYLDQADERFGELNEKEEDMLADWLGKHLGYGGEVHSELTGNITSFERGQGSRATWKKEED